MFISLAKLLVGLKIGVISKYLYINSYYSIKTLKLLYYIYKLGYIRGYSILSYKKVKIYIKYISSKSVLRNIYLVSRPSRKFYMSFRSLKGANVNNFVNVNGFLIISTNKGLSTDVEAMLMKKGGCPIIFVS
jgi:ribosomal protein S8